jgi:hypothetical protein
VVEFTIGSRGEIIGKGKICDKRRNNNNNINAANKSFKNLAEFKYVCE